MNVTSAVMQKSEQGVHPVQPPDPMPLARDIANRLSWDDLRLFLALVEKGSFRGAAGRHGVAVNTVRSRMARMERLVGEALLRRRREGVSLTDAGRALHRIASQMRGAAIGSGLDQSGEPSAVDELRIGTTEALGSAWLTPRLLELQSQFPTTTISLMCDNDVQTDRSHEVDVGIGWGLPRNPELIVSKLATIHYMAFASREYLRTYGTPREPHDLLRHRFIEQAAPGVKSELLDQLVGTDRPPGFLPLRTNSSLAVFWAVANGVGIAFMPTYAAALVGKLVPIDLPFQLKFDIFFYFHPEARGCPRIAATRDWLKRSFDPAVHPWFASAFVHPREFGPSRADNVVPLFKSLV
jgi:DNA-binding transcriptional LysR family regulator